VVARASVSYLAGGGTGRLVSEKGLAHSSTSTISAAGKRQDPLRQFSNICRAELEVMQKQLQ
jgi:hypothetical protein